MTDRIDPRLTRRRFLEGAVVLSGTTLLPLGARAAGSAAATQAALESSPLVYLSPLRRDGSESACHGEVWFVADGGDVLVVTAKERWRARAIRDGLDRARIWVGDFGVWTRSGGKYKTAPTFDATGALVSKDDPAVAKALEKFGSKYSKEWGKWGPRFRDGIADGSRVLLRYRAT